MRFRWLRAQYGRNENLSHGYVNIEGNKSVEKFEVPHPPGEKARSELGAAEKIPSDGSRNAHASKTTKRGAAGFGVVFTARKTWPAPGEEVRLHFHLRRHLASGATKINRNSWYRVRYEALDAAQKANSEGDLYWDAVACSSDQCERRKNPRPPGDGIRYLGT